MTSNPHQVSLDIHRNPPKSKCFFEIGGCYAGMLFFCILCIANGVMFMLPMVQNITASVLFCCTPIAICFGLKYYSGKASEKTQAIIHNILLAVFIMSSFGFVMSCGFTFVLERSIENFGKMHYGRLIVYFSQIGLELGVVNCFWQWLSGHFKYRVTPQKNAYWVLLHHEFEELKERYRQKKLERIPLVEASEEYHRRKQESDDFEDYLNS